MLLSLVEFFPTFRRNALSQSLGVKRSMKNTPHGVDRGHMYVWCYRYMSVR